MLVGFHRQVDLLVRVHEGRVEGAVGLHVVGSITGKQLLHFKAVGSHTFEILEH